MAYFGKDTKLWYVCAATGATIVNLAPLLEIGCRECARVIVLQGVEDARKPTSREQDEALRSADVLRDALLHFGFGAEQIFIGDNILPGVSGLRPPFDFGAWCAVGAALGAAAQNAGAGIVLNLKGGTKEMSIGALVGLQGATAPLAPIMVEPPGQRRPMRVVRVGKTQAKPEELRTLLPLAIALELGGLRQVPPSGDYLIEQQVNDAAQQIFAFSSIVQEPDHGQLIRTLNELCSRKNAPLLTGERLLSALPRRCANKDRVDRLMVALEHVRSAVGWPAPSPKSKRHPEGERAFLAGGWFEAVTYLRLRRDFSDVGVHMNVHVADAKGKAESREATEFDVVLICGPTVHVVECKTSRFGLGERDSGGEDEIRGARSILNKLGVYGRGFAGPYGSISLVTPLPRAQNGAELLRNHDLEDAANKNGVKIFRGADALNLLVNDMRARV